MKKNIKLLIIFLTVFSLNTNFSYSAMSSGGNEGDSLYKSGKKLIYSEKKMEKKNKIEKANELYLKAYSKLIKAYSKDKKMQIF